jgi:mannose/cellobiose epimerase-like protein (N-acyl-D-glucosamine 2-epimerase family)
VTIPYLMNCPHDGDGWCIACVKAQGEELVATKAEYRRNFVLLCHTEQMLAAEKRKLSSTDQFWSVRSRLLQNWQATLPEPYRTEACNILANGSVSLFHSQQDEMVRSEDGSLVNPMLARQPGEGSPPSG